MWDLSLLCGIDTVSWYAEFALRSLVSMSATGSVIVIVVVSLSRPVSASVTRMPTCGRSVRPMADRSMGITSVLVGFGTGSRAP